MEEEKIANVVVIKRDGKKVAFDGMKIALAIKKGFDSVEDKYNEDDINKVYQGVIKKIVSINKDRIKIEQIQDLIESELEEDGYKDVYNSFSDYREKRAQSREIFFEEKRKHKFLKALEKLGLNTKDTSETSVDDKNSVDTMKAYGETISEEFATSYLIKKKYADLHENGDICIKDIGYYPVGTTVNCQIDLEKLFTDGFETENCSIREPQSISSYAVLATLALEETQKDQSGEQAIPAFDYYMAPGVLKTFKKEFRQTIYNILEYTDYDKFIAINGIEREIDKMSTIDFDIADYYRFTREAEELKRMFRFAYKKAMEKTEKATFQSMEGFVHDINSMCNGKVATINLGTDISAEGRMITKSIMQTIKDGVGENKKAISPVIVFKIKKGVNFNETDPNYDLLQMACDIAKTTNNMSFSFIDTQFNEEFYKEGDYNTEVAYFRDGSRVIDNFIDNGKQLSVGRGVISNTVINIPRIALKHGEDVNAFNDELVQKIGLVCEQLVDRLEIQSNKKVYNFPFLMKQGVWIDTEKLRETDKIKRMLKQGVMQISFVGIEEAVLVLTGKGQENKKSHELAISIVKLMKKTIDEYSKKYNLNFVLAGNYDKKVSADFLEFDRAVFGKIKNITDKDSYTLSFDTSDDEEIDKKVRLESAFHELTNGGHVMNIKIAKETDVMKLIRELYHKEIGYVSIHL